ncbi:unnamed protein product [Caretta caretta]
MPFGLCNAPATFQHLVNDIFSVVLHKFVVIYPVNILIFSEDQTLHEQHAWLVLKRLQANSLYGKSEKCEFSGTSVDFLGYIFFPNGISMDHRKLSAISTWVTPKSIHDIQCFLGFASFYR